MSASVEQYNVLFGNVKETASLMSKCACVACNSCTCSCSCRNTSELDIEWERI